MRKAVLLLCVPFISGLIACESGSGPVKRGAIVFGDSSTIVTESDPKFLNDNLTDFRPRQEPVAKDSSLSAPPAAASPGLPAAAANAADAKPATVAPTTVATPEAVPSKEMRIEIPGVAGSGVDWSRKNGVSVSLPEGSLKGKALMVQGLTEVRVQQREQTVVLLQLRRQGAVKLPLPGDYSDWTTLKPRNGSYPISKERASYTARINANTLRNAVQRVAKSNRLNRRETEELLRSLRHVHAATQAPLEPALQSYIWRIDGKDAKGKHIHRELRVDYTL